MQPYDVFNDENIEYSRIQILVIDTFTVIQIIFLGKRTRDTII